jgi:putative redox protein
MNSSVTWHQGLVFTGKAGSGFDLPLGPDPLEGAAGEGFRPLELMAVSLAGCTAMDVISILAKKRQVVTAFEVKVDAPQAPDHPQVFTRALITYLVTGHGVEEAAVLRAIELSATKYCPAQAMLGKVLPMELVYEIREDEGDGKTRLVKQGRYQPQSV